jgi:GAF domain-containing protein
MLSAPIPKDENIRLQAVKDLNILDSQAEKCFDEITKDAIDFFGVPLSTISIIDKDREWFKSCNGMCSTKEGSREISFCGHALLSSDIFIIEDTKKDPRFADNPYVVGPPYIRFYAGMRLLDKSTGQPIAVFCIKDTKPRTLSLAELDHFFVLTKKAEIELNKYKNNLIAV